MKKFCYRGWALALVFFVCLSGCSFVAGQLKDKADEEGLLKPGALDPTIKFNYERFSYKILGRYNVSHDWPTAATPCRYHGPRNGQQGDIYELNGSTFQAGVLGPKPQNIDYYVRPEYQSTDESGNIRTHKRFAPMCFEGWVGTSHGLTIYLTKMSLNDAIKQHTKPDVPLQEQRVGANRWVTQETPLMPRKVNTIAGSYLTWLLPVGDTGYTFVFELGANQDSLKHPEAHARMQEIFRHLVESVKIEPLPEEERLRYEAEAPQREAQMKAALAAEAKRQAEQLEKQRLRKEQMKEKCKKIWNWNDIECKLIR